MEWKDQGLILGVRRHGETSAILEVMTQDHGRCLGLVRGGRSSRLRPVLQTGNTLQVTWRARLEEHLGTFQVEGEKLRAAELMETRFGIHALQTLASHLRLLPERDPHKGLYNASQLILDNLDEPRKIARLLIRFELVLLDELGFGLDLSECAATGERHDLVWVSPKSGRAVSREAGRPYEAQLLSLPDFLVEAETGTAPSGLDKSPEWHLEQGFKLSCHFLERHCYRPRAIRPPLEREGLVRRLLKTLRGETVGTGMSGVSNTPFGENNRV